MPASADNFKKALSLEPLPRDMPVPLWELEFHAWQLFSDRRIILGSEFAELSPADKNRALRQNAEIILEVSEKLDFSAVTVPGGYWEIAPGHPAYYWLPAGDREKQIDLLYREAGSELCLVAGSQSVLAMPDADKYMEFAYTLMEDPSSVIQMSEELCRKGKKQASALIDLGIGAIYTPSDIADNHGPYFNPEQMESMILPRLNSWAEHVHREGGLSILHSDGNLTPILEELAGTSVMALQAIDPMAGMDLIETRDLVKNRLCLCGNIDCGLLMSGSPEEIFESTASLLRNFGDQKGLVLGASNALEKELKKENYLAYLRARLEHLPRT